jgi:hypothetical protein
VDSVGNRRLDEWSLLTLVLVVLLSVFGRQVRSVQIQAERAGVQGTLGALRTALVLSHVTAQLAGDMDGKTEGKAEGNTAVAPIANPFLLLQARPGNYAGDFAMARADTMPLGAWAFDRDCGCVGYRLLYPNALDTPDGAESVWFRLEGMGAVLQLVPLTEYVWQGQVLH